MVNPTRLLDRMHALTDEAFAQAVAGLVEYVDLLYFRTDRHPGMLDADAVRETVAFFEHEYPNLAELLDLVLD